MEDKEKLVLKWLDYDINEAEQNLLHAIDDFATFEKIDQAAQYFKAPELDINASYTGITISKETKTTIKIYFMKYAIAIAAAGILASGLFHFLENPSTVSYYTATNATKNITLPDTSQATLNAVSTITFQDDEWDRSIQLEGEAYFKVAKGQLFTVQTNQGTVQVLGTQFSVKDRPDFFEVTCYEGLVAAYYNDIEYKLPIGTRLRIENGMIHKELNTALAPSWINDLSVFKSTALKHVLKELQRQYEITFELHNVDESVLFTGSFTHTNLKTALQSISIPLGLDYQINDSKVILTKK
jgi:transmembrane sensor